ncbi:MAG: NAD(P)-dependent glycerol-3-phosphate dehydrogenase [Betaproteobacteria bacterium]|nr:NAD(P)-dependent glycerol-3-phosphate dehydrogenase [Betaproteobacteria bacterium]
MNIAVLGAGAWGTALAISFSARHVVTLWTRDPAQRAAMASTRSNARYLPGVTFPPALRVEDDFATATAYADLLLIGTSTAGLGDTARALAHLAKPVVWVCKGFDKVTGLLPHETIASALPSGLPYGALSGPSFAQEVAKGLPCALTLAANNGAFAKSTAEALNSPALRIYHHNDLIGVELGGALKNVMAIAAGLSDGMGLGLNARAALITRGLAEIVRLGVVMGGRAETFMGLTGLGDLVLTATGDLSRNRTVGVELAKGKSLNEILAALGHVAEGVNSAATTLKRARALGVDMPITEAVNAVLFDGAPPREALARLLARETKAESR